jgi:hypothetical protein
MSSYTIVNDGIACVRVVLARNAIMTDETVIDVGPPSYIDSNTVVCTAGARSATALLSGSTWIVLVSQMGDDYYQTNPFQLQSVILGGGKVTPSLSSESSVKTGITPPQLDVYVNAATKTVHIGSAAASLSGGLGSYALAPHALAPHVFAPHALAPHVFAPHALAPHVFAPHALAPHVFAPHAHPRCSFALPFHCTAPAGTDFVTPGHPHGAGGWLPRSRFANYQ